MKNIHVLPTDKPSRLLKNTQYNSFWLRTDFLDREIKRGVEKLQYQNIYITSDDEIKDKTWVLDKTNNRIVFLLSLRKDSYNKNVNFSEKYYKIILTTDQDLIKDGVQDIPDEFLEWFVKNPSCEFVEIKRQMRLLIGKTLFDYKIVIPQEESKQEKERGITITHIGKQKTLEEAAKRYIEEYDVEHYISIEDFIMGAKWQQERSYSEEEVLNLLISKEENTRDSIKYDGVEYLTPKEWFEQFKKK